jgi:heme oxygenase (mycobilin-producing)
VRERLKTTREEAHPAPLESPAGPFVALSRFTVANGMEDEVKRAFVERPRRVEEAGGFLRLEVLSPLDDPREIWLLTYWQDEASYTAWHRSHLHHESHQEIPKGLKLDPKATQIRCFQHVCA